jgi:hypothetical protein
VLAYGRLENMDECELIALVTAAACGISKSCSTDDITLMASVFSQLGDTLATVLTYRELKENKSDHESSNGSNNELLGPLL